MEQGAFKTPLVISIEERKLEFLNSYVTNRKGYGAIYKNGHYRTNATYTLTDCIMQRHIDGEQGIAVKNKEVSKFICFDIDCEEDTSKAKQQAKNIIDVLVNQYDFPLNSIVLSYSGNKGYHVDLLLLTPMRLAPLSTFMDIILDKAVAVEGVHIDKRGCNGALTKLPLGIHQKTKNFCNIIASDFSIEYGADHIPNPYYVESELIFNVVKAKLIHAKGNEISFADKVRAINNAEKEHKKVTKTLKTKALHEPKVADLERILAEGQLITRGTRNEVEFLLALHGNTKGLSKEQTIELIGDILSNTPEELFNDDISHTRRLKLAKATVDNVYKENMQLYQKAENIVKVFNSEIQIIFENCKTLNEMNIALLHLIYSKKHKGVYYLSGEQMAESVGMTRKQVGTLTKKLEEKGLVTKVSKGGIVEETKKANTYKCNIEEMGKKNSEKHTNINVSSSTKIQEISKELFTKEQVKAFVSRRIFEHFK